MYNIRLATLDDTNSLYYMALRFANQVSSDTIDNDKVYRRVLWYLENPEDTVVLLLCKNEAPIGMIAGVKTEALFSAGTTAVEQMWWVEPEYRGSKWGLYLPKLFEEWARRKGCSSCILAGLEKSTAVSKLYIKMGYEPTEYSYLKVFS